MDDSEPIAFDDQGKVEGHLSKEAAETALYRSLDAGFWGNEENDYSHHDDCRRTACHVTERTIEQRVAAQVEARLTEIDEAVWSWVCDARTSAAIGKRAIAARLVLCPGWFQGKTLKQIASSFGCTETYLSELATAFSLAFSLFSPAQRPQEKSRNPNFTPTCRDMKTQNEKRNMAGKRPTQRPLRTRNLVRLERSMEVAQATRLTVPVEVVR